MELVAKIIYACIITLIVSFVVAVFFGTLFHSGPEEGNSQTRNAEAVKIDNENKFK